MIPGDLVDQRFVIERLAGAGGMGAVHRAHDLETGAPVALKVLLGTSLPEDELRFEREAMVLSQLDHPGIVRYVARGLTAMGRPYLAMEWIEGEDLAARLQRGPLSVAETIELGLLVAKALGAAHARGVVHRDLKPANVLLAGSSLGGAKIVDFGLATITAGARATLSGAVVGTPGYMAPEQARGVREPDARADVFALGCILHECLTGRPVFDGRNVMAVLAKVIFDEVPRLCDLGLDVPAALDALIARLLEKHPDARPVDGGAVAATLAAIDTVTEIEAVQRLGSRVERGALTRTEQRIVCVVLAKAPPYAAPDASAQTVVLAAEGQDSPAMPAVLSSVEARDGRIAALADGTIAVTVRAAGPATDQAALAAGCAPELRAALASWAVSVATGRADVAGARPAGDAIERAAQLLDARLRAGGPRTIDLDDATAGLLDLRFDITAGALGLEQLGAEGRTDELIELVLQLLVRMRDSHNALATRLAHALRELYGRKSQKVSVEDLSSLLAALGNDAPASAAELGVSRRPKTGSYRRRPSRPSLRVGAAGVRRCPSTCAEARGSCLSPTRNGAVRAAVRSACASVIARAR
ncbi:Adenylate cyclase [Minicystis rosea]|nr:Adenylate cyclase [Minicystis rosea]